MGQILTWISLLSGRLKAWDPEHLTGEGPGQMVGCSVEIPGPTGQRRGPDSQGHQKAFSPGPEPTLLQMVTGVTEDTRATSNDTNEEEPQKAVGRGGCLKQPLPWPHASLRRGAPGREGQGRFRNLAGPRKDSTP